MGSSARIESDVRTIQNIGKGDLAKLFGKIDKKNLEHWNTRGFTINTC